MRRTIGAIVLVASFAAPACAQTRWVELRRGLVISSSVTVRPKVYRVRAPASVDSAAIIVRGDDVTVDFAGATLEGISPAADPDLASGVAIRVEGGHNVTIRNARIRGYKIAIMARGTRGLALLDNDLSYNTTNRTNGCASAPASISPT
jgi:hypothetical protein